MNETTKQDLAERYKDLAVVAVLTVVGIGGFVWINPEETEIYPGAGGLTWRSLPFIYSGILLFLVALWGASTVLDISRLRNWKRPPSVLGMPKPASSTPVAQMRRVAAFVAILVYAWAIGAFGFALSTPVLLFTMLVVFGRRNMAENLAIALIGSLVCWVLFAGVLKLPLTGDLWDPLTPVLNDLYKMTGLR